jgi:tagatose 1,6-diphosphate aldolase
MEDVLIHISRGKFNGINALANENGVIAAAAMDQRDALRKAIAKVRGAPATDAELSEFKVLVAEELTPYATAILLDPEYGLEVVQKSREGGYPAAD